MIRRTTQRMLMGALVCGLAACGDGGSGGDSEAGLGAVMRSPASGRGPQSTGGGDIDSPGGANPGGPSAGSNCSYTQGYWKNHPGAWPVSQLSLGATVYTKAQLLDIFHTPVGGNGLIAMAHQLIAARLNLAFGASPQGLEATLARADALIGALVVPPVGKGSLDPAATSQTNEELTAFNEGKTGPGHCQDGGKGGAPAPTPPVDGGSPPPPPVTTPVPPNVVE
jgi:hypothetical protein